MQILARFTKNHLIKKYVMVKNMANLQNIADRIFRHVDQGQLSPDYALAMGQMIDSYSENKKFRNWVDHSSSSAIDKMLACMTRHSAWNDPLWIERWIEDASVYAA